MSIKRVNANSMLFEPGTLNGIPMIVTGALLEHETVPAGYYCYDVCTPDEYPEVKNATVLRDLSDHADGCIILAEPLDFQGKEELSMENLIVYEDRYMVGLDEFIRQSEEQKTSLDQEQNTCLVQSM
ncbi:MAG: hypothetical protein QM657_03640 [Lacrimispora sp.]|uniref:LPD28 domain-containing protein n=1 Tax=Lacrimispora sp. TaxID=2719234 RepID=UPI0039E215A8